MVAVNYDWDELEDNIDEEYDDAGATIAEYTTEPYLYGDLVSQRRSGQSRFYHYDGLGSTLALTDSTAAVTDTNAYSAFGEVTEHTGSTTNPFQYVGQKGYYKDEDTGEYSVRRRPYQPAIARWTARDAREFADGMNQYRYGRNGPTLVVDPSGSITVEPIVGRDQLENVGCGKSARIEYDYTLKAPAPCDGYFVQQITTFCNIDTTCSRCGFLDFPGPYRSYIIVWEAFFVRKSETKDETRYSRGRYQFDYTDASEARAHDNACGNISQFFEVRFYCKDPKDSKNGVGTGDLGKYGEDPKNLGKSTWRINRKYGVSPCRVSSLMVPSVGTEPLKPQFWDKDPEENGGAFRRFTLAWCCCPGKGQYVVASASPRSKPDVFDDLY